LCVSFSLWLEFSCTWALVITLSPMGKLSAWIKQWKHFSDVSWIPVHTNGVLGFHLHSFGTTLAITPQWVDRLLKLYMVTPLSILVSQRWMLLILQISLVGCAIDNWWQS
jgi:hypothetical protein